MPPRAPYTPYPRRYPPLGTGDAEALRRRAGRVVFRCTAALVLVLVVTAIDWGGLATAFGNLYRDTYRDEIQRELRRREAEETPATPYGADPVRFVPGR